MVPPSVHKVVHNYLVDWRGATGNGGGWCSSEVGGKSQVMLGILAWRGAVGDLGSADIPSASSHTSRALCLTDRHAEWQVSWAFRGRPVDCRDAETAKNRSPEAISLRTS
ncbi:hypothetical protein Rmf_39980 [Roseomonas fluvialis]|uniref:Uncharacterized protein n=1 Tax=Roseomonas fluvialis TaxID=1750527 RepID=A0ABN6P5X5_9PROT|nr:hypothetical protein Rmf_39980 [Roseomonas fluvialis]